MRQQKLIRLKGERQQGYILITVMAMMILLAFIIIATYTSTDLNLKDTANEADHRYALTLAEEASRMAAKEVARTFADPATDVFPAVTDYNPQNYPLLFTQFLEGGPQLITWDGKPWPQYFTDDCAGRGKFKGFCAPLVIIDGKKYGGILPAWARANVFNDDGVSRTCGNAVTVLKYRIPYYDNAALSNNSARDPCYIVEFLGINNQKILRYRITTMSWGQNINTKVRLETIYETDYDF